MSKFAAAMSILGDAGIDYRRIMQNPARAAKIAAAVDDGPEAVVDLANAMLRGGRPATPPAPAGRDPMPFEDRIANEPKIRAGLEEAGVPTEGMSQQDMLAEYTRQVMGAAPPRGRPRQAAPGQPPLGGKIPGRTTEDAIRALAKPADQVAAENIAGQFDRAAYNPRPDNPQARSRALAAARDSYPAAYDTAAEDLMDKELLGGLPPQYRRLLQELEKNDWLGFDYPSQAVSSVLEYGDAPSRWDMTPGLLEARDAMIFSRGPSPSPTPTRQLELPLSDGPTGLAPYGVRGPGVPVGGVRGMGALYNPGTEMIPAPLRGLPEPEPTGLSVIGERGLIRAPTRGLPGPEPTGLIVRDMPPARTPDLDMPSRLPDDPPPARPRIGPKTKAAAAAAAIGAGAAALAPRRLGDEGLVSGGEADLVAESRPAPQVDATADVPEPTVAQAPRDYSMEARALINRLNDMRRAVGGEVPEARAMMDEINRLLELGNQTRRATAVAAPQDDASRLFQQAQSLIDQVNQMYRQGMTPNSPEVQRAMAQVRQLQAQGDALRNRRAG